MPPRSPNSVYWCWWSILLQIWWMPSWSLSSVVWCWWHILLQVWWMLPWSTSSADWYWCCWWPILLQIWWISHGLLAVLIGGGVADDLYCCYVTPLISLYKEHLENLNLKIEWIILTMNHLKNDSEYTISSQWYYFMEILCTWAMRI